MVSGPRRAREIMVRDVITVAPEDHVLDAMRTLLTRRITGMPVIGPDRRYLGVFSEQCCLSLLVGTADAAADLGLTNEATAADVMTRKLIRLSEDTNAVDAMQILLDHRISGAPVVDGDRFLGVFSERFAMNVLMAFIYDQIPVASVRPFANREMERVIAPSMLVIDIARHFLDTSYRRLPVVDEGELVGQVSRRDVIGADHHFAQALGRSGGPIAADSRTTASQARQLVESHLEGGAVASIMDRECRTIGPETPLLDIAQIFMSTDLRRLPIVDDGTLVGQLSRRDVLKAFVDQIRKAPSPERALLYLSAMDDEQARARFG